MSKKYQHSSKTHAQWLLLDPVIVKDEIIIVKDLLKLKVGDGVHKYSELPFATDPSKFVEATPLGGVSAVYKIYSDDFMNDGGLQGHYFRLHTPAAINKVYWILVGMTAQQAVADFGSNNGTEENVFIPFTDLFTLTYGYSVINIRTENLGLIPDFTVIWDDEDGFVVAFMCNVNGVIDENVYDYTNARLELVRLGVNNSVVKIIPKPGYILGASNTLKVDDFNADLLDGYHASELPVSTPQQEVFNSKKNIPTYSTRILRNDIVWSDGWVKIATTGSTNTKKLDELVLRISNGAGTLELNPIVRYPAALINGNAPFNGFYIKDVDNKLSKVTTFDYIEVEYSIVVDTIDKYDNRRFNLGIGVISNHAMYSAAHAATMRGAFFGVFPDFPAAWYIDSCLDPLTTYDVVNTPYQPEYFALKDADMLVSAITNGAQNQDVGANPNTLEVASHSATANTFVKNNITANELTFKQNTIAVGARNNDMTTLAGTSYGYGMEFFERTDQAYLVAQYPIRNQPMGFAWVNSDASGQILTVDAGNAAFTNGYLFAGDEVFKNLEYPIVATYPEAVSLYNPATHTPTNAVQSIYQEGGFTKIAVEGSGFPINSRFLLWGTFKMGNTCASGGNTQSPACYMVAAKLKKIKLETGVNWQIVREAARATAYLANNTATLSVALTSGIKTQIFVSSDVLTKFPAAMSPGNTTGNVCGRVRINNQYFSFKDIGYNGTNYYLSGDAQTLTFSATQAVGTNVILIWDSYRGFGCIEVESAIQYIKDEYTENDVLLDDLADKLEGENEKYKMLRYDDLRDNTPVPKRMIQDLIDRIEALENA